MWSQLFVFCLLSAAAFWKWAITHSSLFSIKLHSSWINVLLRLFRKYGVLWRTTLKVGNRSFIVVLYKTPYFLNKCTLTFMYDGSVSALTDLANWGPSGPDWTTKIFRTGPKGPEQCCFLLKVGNHSLYTFLLKNSALGHINITIILARRSIGILNWVFMFPSFTCANKSSFCGSFHVEMCLTRAMLHIDFVLSLYKIVLYTFLLKIMGSQNYTNTWAHKHHNYSG